MQAYMSVVEEAAQFAGPPSALYGDEPYRLVREAADGALKALRGDEFYHETYRQMSERIVGFGNYQPDADTVLPDGTVNVARDVTYTDVAVSAVGLLQTGAQAILGGVKDLLTAPFSMRHKPELEGMQVEDEEDAEGLDRPGDEETQEPDEGAYQPSSGSYVPPALPLPEPGRSPRQQLAEDDNDVAACFAAATQALRDMGETLDDGRGLSPHEWEELYGPEQPSGESTLSGKGPS